MSTTVASNGGRGGKNETLESVSTDHVEGNGSINATGGGDRSN